MSAKESQKVKQEGLGTNQPNNSTSLVTPGKAPALGAVGSVPDRNSAEQVRGGKS
jgi:hypothetical protein